MHTDQQSPPDILTEREAAAYLRVSPAFLAASRLRTPRTHGPAYLRFGKVIRYHRDDLDRFLAERRVGERG